MRTRPPSGGPLQGVILRPEGSVPVLATLLYIGVGIDAGEDMAGAPIPLDFDCAIDDVHLYR